MVFIRFWAKIESGAHYTTTHQTIKISRSRSGGIDLKLAANLLCVFEREKSPKGWPQV
jgi:hypothetical protein